MDFKNRHPLNAIEGYESLSMLEALIPFVDYSLKLPLALFLKYSEARLIIKCFRTNNDLVQLGLHNPCNNPLEMVCAFTGMSPAVLKMMLSMMDGDNNSMFTNLFNTSPNVKSYDSDNDAGAFATNFGFSSEDISKAMNLFHSMQAGFDNHESHSSSSPPDSESKSDDSDNFERNLQQLLAEYDLAQAENQANDNKHYNHIYHEYEHPASYDENHESFSSNHKL